MAIDTRALFVGSKQLGLKALHAMVGAIPGRVAGAITLDDSADTRSVLPEFCSYCEGAGIPLSILSGPGDLGGIIQQYSPQYVLVAGGYWIFKPSLLSAGPWGFLGLHL